MKTNYLVRVFLLSGLVFIGTQLFAQSTYEIKGKIVKSKTASENLAKVKLLDLKTMELVSELVCNKDGRFTIENVEKGEYILLVQKPGFPKPETRYIFIDDNGIVMNESVLKIADAGIKHTHVNLN